MKKQKGVLFMKHRVLSAICSISSSYHSKWHRRQQA